MCFGIYLFNFFLQKYECVYSNLEAGFFYTSGISHDTSKYFYQNKLLIILMIFYDSLNIFPFCYLVYPKPQGRGV